MPTDIELQNNLPNIGNAVDDFGDAIP